MSPNCLKKRGMPAVRQAAEEDQTREIQMGILAWIVFGLIAGVIAKMIMPGKDPGGLIITIILGILGAVFGGLIGSALGFGSVSGFDFRSFVIAVIGALLLLWIYRVAKR